MCTLFPSSLKQTVFDLCSCLQTPLMLIAHSRAYKVEQKLRSTLHRLRNRTRPRQKRRMPLDMPSQMRALHPFPDWLTVAIDTDRATSLMSIDETLYDLSKPPSLNAIAYWSMNAYSMDFHC